MNAYSANANAHSLNAFYGYANNAGPNAFITNTPSFVAPTVQAPALPQDSFIPSSALSGNFNYGVQDICDCQFGNGISQDAFIVPAGDQDNPYQNYNATSMELPALDGQSPQQALQALLAQLGITPELLAYLQSQGIDLLGLIAQANGMNGLNGLQTGQDLVLPTTMPANDTPATVYMPANTNSHSTHRSRESHRSQPAATTTPTETTTPAANTTTSNSHRPAANNIVPVGKPNANGEQEYRVKGTNIRYR